MNLFSLIIVLYLFLLSFLFLNSIFHIEGGNTNNSFCFHIYFFFQKQPIAILLHLLISRLLLIKMTGFFKSAVVDVYIMNVKIFVVKASHKFRHFRTSFFFFIFFSI